MSNNDAIYVRENSLKDKTIFKKKTNFEWRREGRGSTWFRQNFFVNRPDLLFNHNRVQ